MSIFPAFYIHRHPIMLFLLSILVQSCASTFKHPVSPSPARLGEYSEVHKKETSQLPEPKEKVYAAVYNFRDQTGQYKLLENSASWSTVVTQGATSVLIQALEESDWFIAIEREGLSNLLNERRIIRQTQEQFQGNSTTLPPLLYAGIIIEGGIIAYESNVRTGGMGARYFGTGTSGQYREDQVTIYLRAVSTSTGRILKTVHASKTILSQKLDMGIFRFVSLKKLLEAEVGYTYNEPSFVAVQAAIDKAVLALIVEGLGEGLWELNNPNDINTSVIKNYFEEKALSLDMDHLGNLTVPHTKSFSAALKGSFTLLDGDSGSGQIKPAGSLTLGFFQKQPVNLLLDMGVGQAADEVSFETNFIQTTAIAQFHFLHKHKNNPFIQMGYGVSFITDNNWFHNDFVWNTNLLQYLHLGAGYQWRLSDWPLDIQFSITNQLYLNDQFDGVVYGKYNDRLWMANIGLQYRFNISK
ncbi:CsgG/HfaB family protein [Geofilum rubicundum]|nr:CsgG/HfaB family protein [Geofilum rubicundum]